MFSLGNIGGEFYFLLLLAFVTAVLAVLGYPILVAPVRANPKLCVRRRFIYWLGPAHFRSALRDEGSRD